MATALRRSPHRLRETGGAPRAGGNGRAPDLHFTLKLVLLPPNSTLSRIFNDVLWWRLIHPARVTSSTCRGAGSAIIRRFYRARRRTAGAALRPNIRTVRPGPT